MVFAGRTAVVTGAAGGIGSAIVQRLMAQGALVHGLDRNTAGLRHLADGASGRFVPHEVDLTDRAGSDRVFQALIASLGGCDVLVNNAGISRISPFGETDDGLLDLLTSVNFFAAFRITRSLLPALRARRGSVVNVASELALVGQPGYSAYCGSKGAVLAWSRALAVELAPEIRVNAVCPGPIDTAMLRAEFATAPDPAQAERAETASIPSGRFGTPAEIAAVVTFLASDAAAYVTGAAWSVDGGKTSR